MELIEPTLRLKERIVQEIGSLGENQSLDLWLMEY